MGAKLTPKVILEGTRLTRKTDLAFALNRHPRIVGARKYEYPSPLVSAEWCAFRAPRGLRRRPAGPATPEDRRGERGQSRSSDR